MTKLTQSVAVEGDCLHNSLQACEGDKDYVSDSARMERQVHTLSRGLAETNQAERVQFTHQSVKDFFSETGLSVLDGARGLTEVALRAHFRLAKICIRYLAMEEVYLLGQSLTSETHKGKRPEQFPLLDYAVSSWMAHTRECDDESIPQGELLALFGWPSNTVLETWLRIDGAPRGVTNLLHALSQGEVLWLSKSILERPDSATYINTMGMGGLPPLSYAAAFGHKAAVKLLLDTGKVDVEGRCKAGRPCPTPPCMVTRPLSSCYSARARWTSKRRTVMAEHHYGGLLRKGDELRSSSSSQRELCNLG